MHWIWSLIAKASGQKVMVRGASGQRVLHLTFDDGPHPTVTPALLDVLAANGAKATFFLLGEHTRQHPEIAERIVREGHVIGNHSMSHPNFRALTAQAQLDQIRRADEVLAQIDGQARHPFRPPRGNATITTILNAFLRSQRLVLWNFDSFDFRLEEEQLLARLDSYAPNNGDILLFHDDMSITVSVLARMLPKWRQASFQFTAV